MDNNLTLTNTRILSDGLTLRNSNDLKKNLTQQEEMMLNIFQQLNLPTENILVEINEREKVLNNIKDILNLLPRETLQQSIYISKFLASVCSGLFDAALNYLWDETVLQIRKRVSQYDLQYFYELAVTTDRKNKLTSEEDLKKIDDSELINGAKEIGLISEIGFRLLDNIKFMRNWASAAHPNQTKISGLQLAEWLETCIKEVINLPMSNITIKIKLLLKNIKVNPLNNSDVEAISSFYSELTQEKAKNLCNGFWGIYSNLSSTNQARQNIKLLLPNLWNLIDEETKYDFGLKYGNYKINNEVEKCRLAREFLQIVNGESYLSDDIKAAELKANLKNLQSVHNAYNNFYTEPQFAKQIKDLVGEGNVPSQICNYYTLVIVEVYLTNGIGICWEASDIYELLINNFNQLQFFEAITAFTNPIISFKLRHNLCENQYRKLLDISKQKVTSPQLINFIERIQNYNNRLCYLNEDKSIVKIIDALKKIIK